MANQNLLSLADNQCLWCATIHTTKNEQESVTFCFKKTAHTRKHHQLQNLLPESLTFSSHKFIRCHICTGQPCMKDPQTTHKRRKNVQKQHRPQLVSIVVVPIRINGITKTTVYDTNRITQRHGLNT